MFTKNKFHQIITIVVVLTMVISGIQPTAVSAQSGDGIKRQVNAESGKVSFIGPENGRVLSASKALGTFLRPQDPALALIKRYAPEFGVKDPQRDLSEMKTARSKNGHLTVRYQQNYNGIPVIGGELIVNTNDNGDLYSMSGEVSPYLSLPTQPRVDSAQAVEAALQAVAKQYQKTPADFIASGPELWIFDESLLQPSTRPVELVWRMDVTAKDNSLPVRELVLVNAERGSISLHFNQIDTAWAETKVDPIQSAQDDNPPTETATSTETPLPTETPTVTETPPPVETPIPTDTPASTEITSNASSANEEITALAATWYVATTGDDVNDCSTIATPCLTIQKAINLAASGDTIHVAIGTYSDGSSSYVANINKDIILSGGWNSSFSLQEGFSIIDGQTTKSGVGVTNNYVTIEYFVIQNGGRGIYNQGTLTINNSTIKNNFSYQSGAGIYSSGDLILNNVTISDNTVEPDFGYGGGGSIKHPTNL